MPLYTPGRRRAIILLLLTSILLLTLDLRGNSIFDAARTGFNKVMDPLESAADVATRPVVNAWHGIRDYQSLQDENQRLREQVDAQRGDWIAAQAAIQDLQALLALNDLPVLADYPTVAAMVVGESPSNLDQVVEINKGRDDCIEVGMAVVTEAGLVGKVTAPLLPHQANVMLITDTRYTTAVKVVSGVPTPTTTTTTAPPPTDPSATPPPDTAPPGSAPPGTPPPGTAPPATPPPATPPPTDPPAATTTTIDPASDETRRRDTGQLNGQGGDKLPQVDLLAGTPLLGRIVVGDLIFTAGGTDSLAPPDVPIGTVRNVVRRSASEGPMLEVQPSVDLDRLHFVRIIRYQPESEAGASTVPGCG